MKKISLLALSLVFALASVASAQVATPPTPNTGFVQFNNLSIQSVSSTNVPAEIIASNGVIPPMGMMNGNGTAATEGGGTASSMVRCYQFENQNSASGNVMPCPIGNGSYRIEVTASTQLMLRDRTAATLGDFTAGDQINVYGYYNSDGSIQAYLVRDISKPVSAQTIQLNNVNLVSVSNANIPATLAVTQEQSAPCYYFNGANAVKTQYACPMGLSSFSANAATQNIQLMPAWIMLKKYAVLVDARTVILDRNRTQLSLSDLKIGDQLNVYGETSDNGQTVNADVIRDLSLPFAASTYSGTVTAVNTDGSFVIQTGDGRTITVQNPIKVGVAVTLQGVLDKAQNILSEISRISIGGQTTIPPSAFASPGQHCGGNIANAPVCGSGYHCLPNPGSTLPFGDVGGTCAAN